LLDNGKLRDRVVVPEDACEEDFTPAAVGIQANQKFFEGKLPKKGIVTQERLVNIGFKTNPRHLESVGDLCLDLH
jgi:leucyl-tRNA synthetase